MELCPICHSPINVSQSEIDDLRSRGIYVWTDDPISTEQGWAGDQYKGLVFFNWRHIKEIQDARIAQEISAGVSQTTFSEINPIIGITKTHIKELRQSTEKILLAINSNLNTYFNYFGDGTYVGTYKYGEKIDDKIEWTDIDRSTGQPSLPLEITFIRAIHIEELRHQFIVGEPNWFEFEAYPLDFSFNSRCPTSFPVEVELFAFYGGINVTLDTMWDIPSAQIVQRGQQLFAIFSSLPSEDITSANYWPVLPPTQDPEYMGETEQGSIDLYEQVVFSGEMGSLDIPFNFTGSDSGCDDSTFSWEMRGGLLLSANWDCSFGSYYLDIYYPSLQAIDLNPPDPLPPDYPYPFTPLNSFPYNEQPLHEIWSGIYEQKWYGNDKYYSLTYTVCPSPTGGYRFYFNFEYKVRGNWWYEAVDLPDQYGQFDGVPDEWQLKTSMTTVITNEWSAGFRKI